MSQEGAATGGFNARLSVTQALDNLASRLDPIIRSRMAVHLSGLAWTVVLNQLDEIKGWPPKVYVASDLQAQLKLLLTRRLGDLGFPLDDKKQTVSTLGRELTVVRNSWAHGGVFSTLDAWRANDFCVRLLEYFEDTEGLDVALRLRDDALHAHVHEVGIAPLPAAAKAEACSGGEDANESASEVPDEAEEVTPSAEVFLRSSAGDAGRIGNRRQSFEPWETVVIGEPSTLDGLSRASARAQVRAVVREITEFEGPVHIERLARLTGRAFGVSKLWPGRLKKIIHQIRQSGLLVDADRFVWPDGMGPDTWREFRPNSSSTARVFTEISPVEVANAMRALGSNGAELKGGALEQATLATFGRRKRTKAVTAHLDRARILLTRGL